MTDLRARIADTLREHRPSEIPTWANERICRLCGETFRSMPPGPDLADHVADVLLSLPGIEIVELPEPDDIGAGPEFGEFDAWWGHYPDNDPRQPSRWPNYDITAAGGRCGYGTGGQFTPTEARSFAAALLAAANAAEQAADKSAPQFPGTGLGPQG